VYCLDVVAVVVAVVVAAAVVVVVPGMVHMSFYLVLETNNLSS
jgi:hypothetical protein